MKVIGGFLIIFFFACLFSGTTPPPPELNRPTTLQSAQQIIKAKGFDCFRATEIRPGLASGFRVECASLQGHKYHYGVEDHGGRWAVNFRY